MRQLAEMDPSLVLAGDRPRLIDEWQLVPPTWDAVRHAVDVSVQKGQFLLTGSFVPQKAHEKIMHSGAGRIARLRMRPMSLFEAGLSTGDVSLEALCRGHMTPVMVDTPPLPELASYIVRGGWPGGLRLPLEQAQLIPKQYVEAVLDAHVEQLDSTLRNRAKMELLLRALARNESATVSVRTLVRDISAADGHTVADVTLSQYLDVFRRLFLTEDLPAFSGRLRSAARVREAPKRHFCDPSLACALLGKGADGLMSDLESFRLLFEAMCIRDLRVYAESFGARVFHYRDYKNREIDVIIELADQRWVAVEIKLGANQIDRAAKSVQKTVAYLTRDGANAPPQAICVVCGTAKAAYQRPDGVFVVPITALRD